MNKKTSGNNTKVNEGERRLNAYVDMLMKIYGVDGYGLADLIGMSHASWDWNMSASWNRKKTSFFINLASITGISLVWFFPEINNR